MHWLVLIVAAIVIGWMASLVLRRFGLGPIVSIPIALIGAALGGALDRLALGNAEPAFSFFGLAALMCVLALAGGFYAFVLTGSERRI